MFVYTNATAEDHAICKDNFILHFQFGCLLYLLSNFFWFELPKLLHIEVVNVGILVLFLILEEKLSLSPLSIMLAEFSYMAFIILRQSYSYFVEYLYHEKGVEFCQMLFSSIN